MLVLRHFEGDETFVEHQGKQLIVKVTRMKSGRVWIGFEGDGFEITRADAKVKHKKSTNEPQPNTDLGIYDEGGSIGGKKGGGSL